MDRWYRARPLEPASLGVIVALMAVAYLSWAPSAPDLAAQVARADVVRVSGMTSWWTGWFGGLSMPSYSVLVPWGMAAVGVRATGLIGVVIGAVGAAKLVGDSARPRAGAIAFAAAQMADLLVGRVTFCVGLAIGLWALNALRAGRTGPAVVLGVGCYFASPLAGLFLGVAAFAVVLAVPAIRRPAAAVSTTLVLTGATMALLFPGTGTMPFTVLDALPAALCAIGVSAACPQRAVRVAALLLLGGDGALLLVPSAIGDNITRLVWVCAVPIVIAYSHLSTGRLVALVLALAIWPIGDTVGQLTSATAPSASADFYAPVAHAIRREQEAPGAGATGQRVEVVDTSNHWGSTYLASLSLARGWERQADVADNPVFYDQGALTVASYHRWLSQLAVGWVALPNAQLDYASVAEGSLIRTGLPYLKPVWSSPMWRLYRVRQATPLASGAHVDAVGPGGVGLTSAAAGTIALRIRWSPYLTVQDAASRGPAPSCLRNDSGWVSLSLPRVESVIVTSQFDPAALLRQDDPDCVADLVH